MTPAEKALVEAALRWNVAFEQRRQWAGAFSTETALNRRCHAVERERKKARKR